MFVIDEKLQSLALSISTNGDNSVIAAPGEGQYLAIDFISFFPTTAVTVTMYSGTTALSGAMPLDAKQTITWENSSRNQDGVITCADNSAFIINLGGAIAVNGLIRYRIVGR